MAQLEVGVLMGGTRKATAEEPLTPGQMWGRDLYEARLAAGFTQTQLAALVPCDQSAISGLEAGKWPPTPVMAARLDLLLNANGKLIDGLRYVRAAGPGRHPDWFRRYVDLERKALIMREWHPYSLSGLLQTEEYARALFFSSAEHGANPDRVDELVKARIGRQSRLHGPNPLILHATMDEGTIRRSVGDVGVMARQLDHLLKASYLPNVRLRIVPFGPGVATGPQGLVALLDLPNNRRWCYTESITYGSCYNDPDNLTWYTRRYDHVQAQALSVSATRQLLRRVQEELLTMNRRPVKPSSVSWFKASYSGSDNGGCIEISADLLPSGYVPIRDSKDPEGPNLLLPTAAFAAFREAVKAGEFTYGERYLRP